MIYVCIYDYMCEFKLIYFTYKCIINEYVSRIIIKPSPICPTPNLIESYQ